MTVILIRNIKNYDESKKSMILSDVYLKIDDTGKMAMLDHSYHQSIDEIIDLNGRYFLMPGFFDTHVHGQAGTDFADAGRYPEKLINIAEALGKSGLSYAMPTLVSLDLETLKKSLAAINTFMLEQEKNLMPGHAKFVGIHLEGPFISRDCKGAHAASVLQSEINMIIFKEIISAAPDVKDWKITLAPDLPGAITFIHDVQIDEEFKNKDISVKVFIGHTNPAKSFISKAIEAGAVGFTHLGNACGEICSREMRHLEATDAKSQLVQWVLENPERCPPGVELISDGKHLSPEFISLVYKALNDKSVNKGASKGVIVTDALGPAGLENGIYALGTCVIRKEENAFYLANESGEFMMKEGMLPDGTRGRVKILAGSGASFFDCVKTYYDCLSLSQNEKLEAIYSASVLNPRNSSLSEYAIKNLASLDKQNFSLLDVTNGKIVAELCQGVFRIHESEINEDLMIEKLGRINNHLKHHDHAIRKEEIEDVDTVRLSFF